MSALVKCDRCGKLMENWVVARSLEITSYRAPGSTGYTVQLQEDLCLECSIALEAWMKSPTPVV